MSTFSLIGRRFVQAIPVLLGVSLLSFAVLNLLPGSTAAAILGTNATPRSVAILNHQLGLDRPFVDRYTDWLSGLLTGHLGTSLTTNQPIGQILTDRLPVSIELALLAFTEALVVAVPLALLAALKHRKAVDHVITDVAIVGLSIPQFVLGLILILVFAVKLQILPPTGFVPLSDGLWANLQTMILPSLTISIGIICIYIRLLRADLIDQMSAEHYIELARAKGMSGWRVLTRHALRNSLFTLLTVMALQIGTILSATVVVESMFGVPGIGSELVNAITLRDAPVVQAIVVVLAVIVVLVNLSADILYSVLDPRVRYGRRTA